MNNGSASVLERGSVHSLAERGSVPSLAERGSVHSLADKPESTPQPVRSRTEEPKERPASDRGASGELGSVGVLELTPGEPRQGRARTEVGEGGRGLS